MNRAQAQVCGQARASAQASAQEGAALIAALLLLAVTVFIGFAAMESSLMQARMAAAQELQEATFQAAEAAIEIALDDMDGLLGTVSTGEPSNQEEDWRDYEEDALVFPQDSTLRASAQIRFIGQATLPGYSLRRGAGGLAAHFYEVRATAWREGERAASTHVQGIYVEGPAPALNSEKAHGGEEQ